MGLALVSMVVEDVARGPTAGRGGSLLVALLTGYGVPMWASCSASAGGRIQS